MNLVKDTTENHDVWKRVVLVSLLYRLHLSGLSKLNTITLNRKLFLCVFILLTPLATFCFIWSVFSLLCLVVFFNDCIHLDHRLQLENNRWTLLNMSYLVKFIFIFFKYHLIEKVVIKMGFVFYIERISWSANWLVFTINDIFKRSFMYIFGSSTWPLLACIRIALTM